MMMYSFTKIYRSSQRQNHAKKLKDRFSKKYGKNIGDIFYADEIEKLRRFCDILEVVLDLDDNVERFSAIPSQAQGIKRNVKIEGKYLPVYRKNKQSLDFFLICPHPNVRVDVTYPNMICKEFEEETGIELCDSKGIENWDIIRGAMINSWE